MMSAARTVIVDEIPRPVAGKQAGASHLALTLERLEHLAGAAGDEAAADHGPRAFASGSGCRRPSGRSEAVARPAGRRGRRPVPMPTGPPAGGANSWYAGTGR